MGEIRTRDGTILNYEIDGPAEGVPLVFSNSLGTNLHMWDGQVGAAKQRGFRVIRYDQRGHGRSGATRGDYTFEILSKDLLDLLNVLDIDKAALCGLSMGGMTGICLAIHHPQRFARMALCNTTSFMGQREFWDARIKAVNNGGMESVADAVLARWLTPEYRERHMDEAKRVREMVVSTNPIGYVGCSAAIRDMDFRDYLARIRMPALVVIGMHDPATTPEMGELIAASLPGVRKAAIDSAHLSNIEKPEEFNRIVLDFLAEGWL